MSGIILVADTVPTNRAILRAKLSGGYYQIVQAASAAETLACARREAPDLILLSTDLTAPDGLATCRMLKADDRTADIPVILVGHVTDICAAFAAGADDLLIRPFGDAALFARVRNLMRMKLMFDDLRLRDATGRDTGPAPVPEPFAQAAQDCDPGRVLLAPADLAMGADWVRELAPVMPGTARICCSHEAALAQAAAGGVSVAVIHERMRDGASGLRLVAMLRTRVETRHLPIVLVVDGPDGEAAALGLDLGANDFLLGAHHPRGELLGRVRCQLRRAAVSRRLRAALRDSLRLSLTDPLTQLYNRRYARLHMPRLIARARETGAPFAVMMLDLDHFKQVNDRHGHGAGDHVLVETAARLQGALRTIDLLARFGGEEFFVAMPDATPEGAAGVAERVRTAIESRPMHLPCGAHLSVTISIGVAMIDPESPLPIDALLDRADKALYASKAAGRNCVRFDKAAA